MQAYPRNGSNAQKFIVEGDTNKVALRTVASGGSLRVGRSSGAAGRPGGVAQVSGTGLGTQWATQNETAVTVDGNAATAWTLLCADSHDGMFQYGEVKTSGGGTYNVELTPYGSQKWAFVPSWITDTSAGAVGGCVVSDGQVVSGGVLIVQEGAHIISLLAKVPDGYQPRGKARWRKRIRQGDFWMSWSEWQSVQGNVTGDGGWGAPGVPATFATTEVDGQTYAIVGAHQSMSLDVTQGMQYECEVALLSSGTGSDMKLGSIVSFSRRVERQIELDAADCDAVVAYDGLRVSYSVNTMQPIVSAYVTVRDADGAVLCRGKGKSPSYDDGTVVIPWNEMTRMVDDGETLSLTITLTTNEGIPYTNTVEVVTTYDGDHGADIDPTVTVDGALVRVSSAAAGDIPTGTKIWLQWQGTTEVITDSFKQGKTYTAVPPLGVPYHIWLMWNDPSNPDKWASNAYESAGLFPEPSGWFIDALDFSWQLPIRANLKERPSLSVQYKPTSASENVMGRTRPVTSFGSATEKTWSVDGIITDRYGDDVDELLDAFERCAEGTHVWFRDARGMRERAAITSAEIDRSRANDYPIKIDFTAEVW